VMDTVRNAAADSGIDLLSVGIDPANPVERVPRQLHGERYVTMEEYLATRGPNLARMMRPTAASQVSLDVGANPARGWRLLPAPAPYARVMLDPSAPDPGPRAGHKRSPPPVAPPPGAPMLPGSGGPGAAPAGRPPSLAGSVMLPNREASTSPCLAGERQSCQP